MANSKAIGVAYSDQDIVGADNLMANRTLGYTAQGQSAVTQLTSKATPVTINAPMGVITTAASSLASAIAVNFTVTNSFISAGSVIALNIGSLATTSYTVSVRGISGTTFVIGLTNISGGSLAEAVPINFAIITAGT